MLRVNKMNIKENVLFVKYLKDMKLPVEKSINQLNKLGAILPPENHFIRMITIERVDEKELFRENNILTKEQLNKCSFLFEKYIVLHVVMINDKKYEMVLGWNKLQDVTARFKDISSQVQYYLENEEEVNKEFLEEINKNLFQLYK